MTVRLRARLSLLTPRRSHGNTHDVALFANTGHRVEIRRGMTLNDPCPEDGVPACSVTLGTLLDSMTAASGELPRLDHGAMRVMGGALGGFIWKDRDREEIDELWIETTDPLIAELPWVLAQTPNTESLAAANCPVAIRIGADKSGVDRQAAAGLPARPRMLVVVPQPKGAAATKGDQHLEELRSALPWCDILPEAPRTRAAMITALRRDRPEILYYYGHGELRPGQTESVLRLLMQKTDYPEDGIDHWAIGDLANVLKGDRDALDTLGLVYLNSCWSGTVAGGGAPFAIAPLVPALISNRTSAIAPAARNQAIDILTNIVGRGVAPHEAVAQVATDARCLAKWGTEILGGNDEPWWMTPTVFASYDIWREPIRPAASGHGFTERETLALDRGSHCAAVRGRLSDATEDRAVTLLLWCGAVDDGLITLSDRLRMYLTQDGSRVWRLTLREADWPGESEALQDAELARKIAAELRAAARVGLDTRDGLARAAVSLLSTQGGIALVEFAMIPGAIGPAGMASRVRAAIAALTDELARPLKNDPAARRVRVVAFLRLEDVQGAQLPDEVAAAVPPDDRYVAVEVLPPLDAVTSADVVTFLGRARPPLPLLTQREIARRILAETKGLLEPTRTAVANPGRYARD